MYGYSMALMVLGIGFLVYRLYARETQSHSTHPYNYTLLVSHTITMQGIRNDDQSLSPVTPLVSLLFLSFLIP